MLHSICVHCTIIFVNAAKANQSILLKPVTQFSGYAFVDTTNVFSSYLMNVDMHRFALMCQYRNRFFKVVPNLPRSVGNQF